MILNYQKKEFILAKNKQEVRQTWLGMDITLTELNWLILGNLPDKTPDWQRSILHSGELQIRKGTTEIHIRFNKTGQIVSMRKFIEGLLEYHADIPLYQKHYNLLFPRKINIENYGRKNKWLMVISEIETLTEFLEPLNFIAPPEMKQLLGDY